MSEEKASYEVVNVEVESKPSDMILAAVKSGADLDKLERLLALQIKWEENEAKKAYVRAVAAFKANPPEILKTAHVCYMNSKDQKVEWDHAVLGEIAEAITRSLSPYELYHRWDMAQEKDLVKTTCILTHSMGHSERVTMQGPPDTSGGKDELKAVSSTNTLFQRLTLLAVTGLAAKGMDRETGPNEVKYISDTQKSTIVDMIQDTGTDEAKFLAYLKVDAIELIPEKQFNQAMVALKAKKSKIQKKERVPGEDG